MTRPSSPIPQTLILNPTLNTPLPSQPGMRKDRLTRTGDDYGGRLKRTTTHFPHCRAIHGPMWRGATTRDGRPMVVHACPIASNLATGLAPASRCRRFPSESLSACLNVHGANVLSNGARVVLPSRTIQRSSALRGRPRASGRLLTKRFWRMNSRGSVGLWIGWLRSPPSRWPR